MLEKVQTTFQEIFSVEPEKVTQETTINNLREWDSLKHLQMVMKLEQACGVKFEMAEIVEMDSVEKILKILNDKGAA